MFYIEFPLPQFAYNLFMNFFSLLTKGKFLTIHTSLVNTGDLVLTYFTNFGHSIFLPPKGWFIKINCVFHNFFLNFPKFIKFYHPGLSCSIIFLWNRSAHMWQGICNSKNSLGKPGLPTSHYKYSISQSLMFLSSKCNPQTLICLKGLYFLKTQFSNFTRTPQWNGLGKHIRAYEVMQFRGKQKNNFALTVEYLFPRGYFINMSKTSLSQNIVWGMLISFEN